MVLSNMHKQISIFSIGSLNLIVFHLI